MMLPSADREIIAYFRTPPGRPYAVPLPGTAQADRSPIYRHWRVETGPLVSALDPNALTLHDLFEQSLANYPNKPCLGWRPWNAATRDWEPRYVWMSYSEAATRRRNMGAGIVEVMLKAGVTQEKYGVGLWAQNCPEWTITHLGLVSQSLWPVSLYESLGAESSEYILNHGNVSCCVSSLPHIPTLIKLAARVPSLKVIISLDPLDAGEKAGHSKLALLRSAASEQGLSIYSMADVEAIGAASGRPMRAPGPDDIITINYTSGTTGDPKGVILTHANCAAGVAVARIAGLASASDVHFSYLPLAHIYGRMGDESALAVGASIGYFHGDILGLLEDMKLLSPTGFISVPRLYNRISTAIQAATVEASGVRGSLSRRVIDTKKASMKQPPGHAHNSHWLYDRIWTPKVLKNIGFQRATRMISGSAQLDPDVQEFLRAALGIRFSQGYGMTESYAAGTLQEADDFALGTIGAPSPCVELCIQSVPEYEYTVRDEPFPRGELLMRGPLIFREYYKNTEATAQSFTADGWFQTGDIVQVDAQGRFAIIDRKKSVLKLAQGEYISPERVENVYLAGTHLLSMAFVHGDPKQSTLVAVLGIEPVPFAAFASAILGRAVSADDPTALKTVANEKAVRMALLQKLDEIGQKHRFNSFEKVRNVYLDVEPFTVDNELLTPTLKLKRPQAVRAFARQIDQMYAEMAAQSGGKAKL